MPTTRATADIVEALRRTLAVVAARHHPHSPDLSEWRVVRVTADLFTAGGDIIFENGDFTLAGPDVGLAGGNVEMVTVLDLRHPYESRRIRVGHVAEIETVGSAEGQPESHLEDRS